MKNRSIYLAGPINNCSDAECKDWRAFARADLEASGFAVLDPMVRDYRGRELEPGIAKEIVEQDKLDIYMSSGVLVCYDRHSSGTAMEIYHAWSIGRPVFIAHLLAGPPSPWLRYHSQCISPALADSLCVLKDHFARR